MQGPIVRMTFCICLVAAGATIAAATNTAAPAPEIAIPALWVELDENWNERNAHGFSEVFTADADLQFVDAGLTLAGRRNILQHFSDQFPTFPPDIRHETSVTRIHALAKNLRAVDATVRILRSAEDEATVLRTYSLFAVMLELPEGWRIHVLRAYLLPAEPKSGATINSATTPSTRAGP